MEMIVIPSGCVEYTNKTNCFKVNRKVMEEENGKLPNKHIRIQIMSGGYPYIGEIYHKSVQYIYLKFYL